MNVKPARPADIGGSREADSVALRIAVLSDSHDRLPSGLSARFAAADEIWHLGDVCDPRVLSDLEQLGKPLQVVAGNCDAHPAWPRQRRIERAGRIFWLEHIPRSHAPPGVDFMLHGHTHVPRDEIDAMGVRWLNPGSVSSPRHQGPPSFAWLTLEVGPMGGPAVVTWRLQSL